jgi:bacteriocin-like protein
MKKANLLQLSSQLMTDKEMQNVSGGQYIPGGPYYPKPCSPSSGACHDIHSSVNNGLDNMRKNNPPVVRTVE